MNDEKVFFDTNILVYANDVSSGAKRQLARGLITEKLQAGTGTVSTQVLAEFWVTITRKLPRPLEQKLAEKQLVLLSAFTIVPIDFGIFLSAIKIQKTHGISYWDAQIIAAAAQAACTILYSEDLQDSCKYEGVKVYNPFISASPK
jgi:predicted nucleic acid-binding protein